MARVELHPAYWFLCDNCGAEQFVRSPVAELTDDEREEMRDNYDVQSWESGVFHEIPQWVTCDNCHTEMQTERIEHGPDEPA
jgi:hypothetical protein